MTKQELASIRDGLQQLAPEFSKVLPPSIPVERFVRVVQTAVQRNPDLLACSRRSLFLACQQCAEDGLYPDGKQAVLLSVRSKQGPPNCIYVPMVAGIKQKIRDGGGVADIICELVREGDSFSYWLGEEPRIVHVPLMDGDINRQITHVYSVVRYKDGSISRNVMHLSEVLMIRDRYSRSKSGPWYDPASIGEMTKKTCLKRHAKLLATTPEIDTILERDNELYDVEQQPSPPPANVRLVPRNVTAALDAFSEPDVPESASDKEPTHWTEEGYINAISDRISTCQTQKDIDNLHEFWNETSADRDLMGLSPALVKTLELHIRKVRLPE